MSDQAPSVVHPTPASIRERGPDKHMAMAKRLVVHNYNSHHRSDTKPLKFSDIRLTWFSEMPTGWRAMAASEAVRGLIWEVSYDSALEEAHIVIWRKVNNVVIDCKEEQKQ